MAVISALAIVAMVWNIARLRGVDPVKAVAIVGLNPLLVLYGIGGGHNDLLMLVPLVGAVYVSLLGRERMTGGLTMLAVGIKFTAGLVLPFALAAGGPLRDRTRRKRLLLGIGSLPGRDRCTRADRLRRRHRQHVPDRRAQPGIRRLAQRSRADRRPSVPRPSVTSSVFSSRRSFWS